MHPTIKKQPTQSNCQIVSIYIRNSKKQAFVIQTKRSQTYNELVKLIQAKTKIQPENQILYYNGKKLQKETKVQLVNKSIVHVIDKKNVNKLKINISVKKIHGSGIQQKFSIDSDTSIENFIRQNLSKTQEQSAEDLYFVYTGRQLKKDKSFSDQFVQEGSEIICMRQSKSMIKNNQLQQQKNIQAIINKKMIEKSESIETEGKKQNQISNLTQIQHQNVKNQFKYPKQQQKIQQVKSNSQIKQKKLIKCIDQIQCKQYQSDQDQKQQLDFEKPKPFKDNNLNKAINNSNMVQQQSTISQPNFKKKNKQIEEVSIFNSKSISSQINPQNTIISTQPKKQSIFQFNTHQVSSIVQLPDFQSQKLENNNKIIEETYNSQLKWQEKQIYEGKGFMNLSNDNFLQYSAKNKSYSQIHNFSSSNLTQKNKEQNCKESQNTLIKSQQTFFVDNKAPELLNSYFENKLQSSHNDTYKDKEQIEVNNANSLQYSHNLSKNEEQLRPQKNDVVENSEKQIQQQQSNLLQQSQFQKNTNKLYKLNEHRHQSQINIQMESINFSFQPNSIMHQQQKRREYQNKSKQLQLKNSKQQLKNQIEKDHSIIQNLIEDESQKESKNDNQQTYNVRVTQVHSISSEDQQFHNQQNTKQKQESINNQQNIQRQVENQISSSQVFLSYQAYQANTESLVSTSKNQSNLKEKENQSQVQSKQNDLQNKPYLKEQAYKEKINQNQIEEDSAEYSGNFFHAAEYEDTQKEEVKKIEQQSQNKIIYQQKPSLLPGDYVYLGQSNVPQQQDVLKDIITKYMHCF